MDLSITGIELGAFLFSTMAFFKMQKRQIEILEYLSFFEKSVVFTPSLLKKVLNQEAPRFYTNSIKDFEEGENYVKGLLMVQGRVEGGELPILSSLNRRSRMVLRSFRSSAVYSNLRGVLPFGGEKVVRSFLRRFELSDFARNGGGGGGEFFF